MIKAIAFDLDDTLIATSEVLVPIASKAAFTAMSSKGVEVSFEIFDQERRQMALSKSHQLIFRELAKKYGRPFNEDQVTAGIKAFYNPPLPSRLELMPGAEENLKYLKEKYKLFLVTTGAIETQREKAARSGISHYFQKMFFLNSFKKERKRLAFEEILQTEKLLPEQLLSVGNRLPLEIHDAKQLGCFTCYFKYGEHIGEVAQNSFENPDYTITRHQELIKVCQL